MEQRKFDKDKSWLKQKYIKEGLYLWQIAELCDVNKQTICNWLKEFKIKARKGGHPKGTKFTEEHKTRMRKAHNYTSGKEHHWWGRKHTKETKEKMSKTKWQGGDVRTYGKIARRIWEEYWREKVPVGYIVHHVDKNVKNNQLTNLALFPRGFHSAYHNRLRRRG